MNDFAAITFEPRLRERPRLGQELLGTAGNPPIYVTIHWPTREEWSSLKKVPILTLDGKSPLKLHEARRLYQLLGFAVERMGDAVEANQLPWEEPGRYAH